MTRRRIKVFALACAGGFLLQLGGCVGIIIQILLQNAISGVLSTALSGLVGTANTTTP